MIHHWKVMLCCDWAKCGCVWQSNQSLTHICLPYDVLSASSYSVVPFSLDISMDILFKTFFFCNYYCVYVIMHNICNT